MSDITCATHSSYWRNWTDGRPSVRMRINDQIFSLVGSITLLILFIVSLLDDMRGLRVRSRLLAQITAAAILVSVRLLKYFSIAIQILCIIWMTNLLISWMDQMAGCRWPFGFTIGVALMHGG